MGIYKELKNNVINQIHKVKHCFKLKYYRRLYPDYEDNSYNIGSLQFIWGVKSHDDLSDSYDAHFYTMNDIDITYDRKTKLFMLGIETAYALQGNRKEEECKYLRQLLEAFTEFMNDNGYSKTYDKCLFMAQPTLLSSAESIEELYINFKIFVEGYCKVYG